MMVFFAAGMTTLAAARIILGIVANQFSVSINAQNVRIDFHA
jgi:hypothetical protein